MDPAAAPPSPVAGALQRAVQTASRVVAAEMHPAMDAVTQSQDALAAEMRALDHEMATVTAVLHTVKLDPHTSARMDDTRAVLARTKRKLTTIRGRLGRLRMYEESDRLHLAETQLIDLRDAAGASAADHDRVHVIPDQPWQDGDGAD